MAEAHVLPTLLTCETCSASTWMHGTEASSESVGRFCQLDSTRFTIYHIFYFLTKIFCFQSSQSIPTMVLVQLCFFLFILSVRI